MIRYDLLFVEEIILHAVEIFHVFEDDLADRIVVGDVFNSKFRARNLRDFGPN
jgi:hypothetical protein